MEVRRVIFEAVNFEPWVMRVIVLGEGFEQRATPIVVKVGGQQLEAIMPLLDLDGVMGFLPEVPAAGDPVIVGYANGLLIHTDFFFQP